MRWYVALFAVVAASCASDPAIVGPYMGRASPEDIRQIKEIASHPKEGWASEWAPLRSIWFEAPDRAKVALHDAHYSVWFTVRKSGTRWMMVPDSLTASSPVYHDGDSPEARAEELRPQIGH
jgi:hypothetical protein